MNRQEERHSRQTPAEGSRKKIDRQLSKESDSNDLSGTAPYGHSKLRSKQADFDRNRDGLYGGLPDARDKPAAGGKAKKPHSRNSAAGPKRH